MYIQISRWDVLHCHVRWGKDMGVRTLFTDFFKVRNLPAIASQFWDEQIYISLSNNLFLMLFSNTSKNFCLMGGWEHLKPARKATSSLAVSSVPTKKLFYHIMLPFNHQTTFTGYILEFYTYTHSVGLSNKKNRFSRSVCRCSSLIQPQQVWGATICKK